MFFKSFYKNLRTGFTVWEMILTISTIMMLSLILFAISNPFENVSNARNVSNEFVLKALQRAIVIYESDNTGTGSLFAETPKEGFYLICNQKAKQCSGNEGNYINLNPLVEKEYITHVPNHSEFANNQINGFVLHYYADDKPPILMTYGDWETIGRPQ